MTTGVLMKQRQDKRNKIRIYIQPETFYHLCRMAAENGMKHPGNVVDKLVRSMIAKER